MALFKKKKDAPISKDAKRRLVEELLKDAERAMIEVHLHYYNKNPSTQPIGEFLMNGVNSAREKFLGEEKVLSEDDSKVNEEGSKNGNKLGCESSYTYEEG